MTLWHIYFCVGEEASQRLQTDSRCSIVLRPVELVLGDFHLCDTLQIHISHGNPFLLRSRAHNNNSLSFYLLYFIKL